MTPPTTTTTTTIHVWGLHALLTFLSIPSCALTSTVRIKYLVLCVYIHPVDHHIVHPGRMMDGTQK